MPLGSRSSTGSFGADTFTSLVVDSLFVGETDNIGNPVTPEEKAYGRSLPKRRFRISRSAATSTTIIAMTWSTRHS